MGEQSRRLDSWKEIAEYLGRDVRTALRWAKTQDLPVRRVAGGKVRSVFALTSELDAWMAGRTGEAEDAAVHTAAAGPPAAGPPAAGPPTASGPSRVRRPAVFAALAAAAAAAVMAAVVMAAPAIRTRAMPRLPVRASVTAGAVTVTDSRGVERTLHDFDPSVDTIVLKPPSISDIDADGRPDVLVGVAYYEDLQHRNVRSGELINVAADGAVRWRFAFDDQLPFRDGMFKGPWAVTDWQAGPAASPARIAVAAHDAVWWASMAAVIDHTGRRLSTFVNPGWIESLLWLDRDRLAAAGFSNARNGAMLAIIDAGRALTQAPGSEGTPFQCTACPAEAPLFYASFPRSELNVLTASRFNRAQLSWHDNRLLVTTIEIPGDPIAGTAHYEFDRELRFVRARYSDTYWDVHAQLEREGRITHTREACPDREGPRGIDVWTPAGWTRMAATR